MYISEKGSPEAMQPYYYDGDNTEVLKQLMGALATLENLQEG